MLSVKLRTEVKYLQLIVWQRHNQGIGRAIPFTAVILMCVGVVTGHFIQLASVGHRMFEMDNLTLAMIFLLIPIMIFGIIFIYFGKKFPGEDQ